MYKSEAHLQSCIAVAFSQDYPEQYGRLFMVNNRTLSLKDGIKLKSMGMIPGASDMIYLDSYGGAVGLEIKMKGKAHKREHIERQLEFGLLLKRFFILTDESEIHHVVRGEWEKIEYGVENIQKLMKDTTGKRIVF